MSWLSDFFKPKKVEIPSDKTSGQSALGGQITDWASKYLNSYVPMADYPGKFTAQPSAYEKQGLGWLQQYLDQPSTGEGYNMAAGEVGKTLSGGYNPYTSPEYDAFKKGASLDLDQTLSDMKRGQGVRGSFFQNTAYGEEAKARTKTQNYLDQILAGMSERERERKLQAVPMAMGLEEYAQGVPLKKATAASTLGALPRMIEQSDLEAQYNDFLRKQKEGQFVVGAAQNIYNAGAPTAAQTFTGASPFERIMGTMAPVLGSLVSSFNPLSWFSGGSKTSATTSPAM